MLAFDIATSAGVPSTLMDKAREEARSVGYATGWSSGVQDARLAMAAELTAAHAEAERLISDARTKLALTMTAIDRAAAAVEAQAAPTAAEIEDLIMTATFELTKSLLGRELRSVDTAADALTRSLALAPANEPVIVVLSQQDYDNIALDHSGSVDPAVTAQFRRPITVECDPSLSPGDAVVRSGATTIDARLSAGLARVRDALDLPLEENENEDNDDNGGAA